MFQSICGVDVAKREWVCALVLDGQVERTWTVPNTAAGHRRLLRALPAGTLVVLEPTASYHRRGLAALVDAHVPVRLVNAAHVRRFAQARGRGTKTDRLDALVLAQFAAAVPGPLYVPPSPARQRLRELHARLVELQQHAQAEHNRLAHVTEPVVRRSIQAMRAVLAQERRRLEAEVAALIAATPELRDAAALLQTIPGVGVVVTRTLLAELPDLRTFRDASQLAAYVGLAPVTQQSGTTLHRAHLPRGGKPHVRATLYLPTWRAVDCNPDLRALAARLTRRGKPRQVIAGACMHKLLRLCYGVCKHQRPYTPQAA